MQYHIEYLCKKASNKLSALIRLARLMPFDKKKILMYSFVQSQFSFSPILWMFTTRKLNNKINSIHKRALQTVFLDYDSTFEELLLKGNTVTIHRRNIQHTAIEMFKIIKKIGPKFMGDLVTFNHSARNDRTFHRPNVNTVQYGENSFRYLGPIVWDQMLPTKFKDISKLKKFKEEIRKWIPNNCPCSLCKEYVGGVGYVTTFE